MRVATSLKLVSCEVDSQSVQLRRGNPFLSWFCMWLPYGDFDLIFASPNAHSCNVLFLFQYPWWSRQLFWRSHPGMDKLFSRLIDDTESALKNAGYQVRRSVVPLGFVPVVARVDEVASRT